MQAFDAANLVLVGEDDVVAAAELLARGRTGGRGVDVVLNSLPGEWIDASIGLLAAHGRFLRV